MVAVGGSGGAGKGVSGGDDKDEGEEFAEAVSTYKAAKLSRNKRSNIPKLELEEAFNREEGTKVAVGATAAAALWSAGAGQEGPSLRATMANDAAQAAVRVSGAPGGSERACAGEGRERLAAAAAGTVASAWRRSAVPVALD